MANKAYVQSLLAQIKSAIEQPRMHVYYYFDKLKTEIDIASNKIDREKQ